MNQFVMHPSTQSHIKQFLSSPVHAVLLLAPQGSGKGSLAQFLAAKLLNIDLGQLANHSFFSHLEPENKAIPIEAVRSLITRMHLKTIGQGSIRRVAIIEQAHHLTAEAQNALLKLLEEPPADTVLILTATGSSNLLPTIHSRLRRLPVQSPDHAALAEYFTSREYTQEQVQRALLISDNRVGLAHALLAQDQEHPLVIAIDQAKRLLGSTLFDRLSKVDTISKHKEELPDLLDALAIVAHAALRQAVQKQQLALVRRWHKTLQQIMDATKALPSNPQPKLLLVNLFLSI